MSADCGSVRYCSRKRTLRFFADGRVGEESGRSGSDDPRRSACLRRALRFDGGMLFSCRWDGYYVLQGVCGAARRDITVERLFVGSKRLDRV